ncbi:MAG: 2-dehydropantoate 2-reductase [Mesorhizobium sp.]
MANEPRTIVIAGTGSVGSYVGGCLALAGRDVRFLARPAMAAALRRDGLRVTDLEGRNRHLASVNATDDAANALSGAKVALICVKSGATGEMAQLVARHAPADCVIVGLQNGTGNVARIEELAGGRPVHAGMVPFNIALDLDPPSIHRGTEGGLVIDEKVGDIAELLRCEGLSVETRSDMDAVLWGKLLLNLNNALNALSGLPLAAELADRRWRRLLATQMDEALAAMAANRIRPAKLAGVAPALLPHILRLPDWLFSRIARKMLAIDPQARSSTWDDLTLGRATEIDEFQGAIARLAAKAGTPAPLTRRIIAAIRHAEAEGSGPPSLDPGALA